MQNQIQVLTEKLKPLGFVLQANGVFKNNNLLIYYRDTYKEWRLKDLSVFSTMDICTIDFPLDDVEMSRIWRYCSDLYKEG